MPLFNQFPHIANYKLSVWPSPVVFSGTITGSPARGAQAIPVLIGVDNPHFGGVMPGYTLEVHANSGTSRDWSKVRIRSYNPSTFTVFVAENAIEWASGQEFRVYKEMQPWSIKPRIIVSGNQPTFFKDYDIAYTNQNQVGRPVINMGPHRAGPNGARLYYTGLSSFDEQDLSIESYSWVFEGGSPGTSSIQSPGYINYPLAGNYLTRLTCVNTNGVSQTSYRFVNIGQEIVEWGIESIEGDVGAGYTLKGWSRTTLNGTLRAGALVVVYGEEKYAGVLRTATEPPYAAETIFSGYIVQRSVKWNSRFSRWDFEAVSVSIYADKLDVYDTSLQFRETSNRWQWWKYYRLTADKAIIHHLRWHTNILDIADFLPTGDTRFVKNIDIGRGGPFSSIRQFLSTSLPGYAVCDIQGRIHIARDPNIQEVGDRLDETWFTLGPEEYREEPYVVDADPFETSHMGAGGYAFSGATGTSTPYLSAAPMEAADDYGKPNDVQGLILTPGIGQQELNDICGHLYARDNNEFADTNWPLVGNFRPFVDLVPRRKVLVNTPTDPLAWVNKVFYVNHISHKYDSNTAMMLTDLNMSAETIGLPGISEDVPVPEPPEPPPPPPPPPPIIPPQPSTEAKVLWIVHSKAATNPPLAVIYEILDDYYAPVYKALIPPPSLNMDDMYGGSYDNLHDMFMLVGHASATPVVPGWAGGASDVTVIIEGALTDTPTWSLAAINGVTEIGTGNMTAVPNAVCNWPFTTVGYGHVSLFAETGGMTWPGSALGSNFMCNMKPFSASPSDSKFGVAGRVTSQPNAGQLACSPGGYNALAGYFHLGATLKADSVSQMPDDVKPIVGSTYYTNTGAGTTYDYVPPGVGVGVSPSQKLFGIRFVRATGRTEIISMTEADFLLQYPDGDPAPWIVEKLVDEIQGALRTMYWTNTKDVSNNAIGVFNSDSGGFIYTYLNGVWGKSDISVSSGLCHFTNTQGGSDIIYVQDRIVVNSNVPAKFTNDIMNVTNNPFIELVGNMWTDTSSPKIITSGDLDIRHSFLSF